MGDLAEAIAAIVLPILIVSFIAGLTIIPWAIGIAYLFGFGGC